MASDKIIKTRVKMDYYIKYLKPQGNISELIRKALDDWLLRNNPIYNKSAIRREQKTIREIKEKSSDSSSYTDEVSERLNKSYKQYLTSQKHFDKRKKLWWIKKGVLYQLKKLGCKEFTAEEILEIFEKHDCEGLDSVIL
jgi:Arc/MetJ-type ribon-helix-helix transcriptional regulator